MIAEVADTSMLQGVMLRWGAKVSMREHVEWTSVAWVKNVLKSLDEDEGCLGRRMESFDIVEAEVCTSSCNHILYDDAIWFASLVSVVAAMLLSLLYAL